MFSRLPQPLISDFSVLFCQCLTQSFTKMFVSYTHLIAFNRYLIKFILDYLQANIFITQMCVPVDRQTCTHTQLFLILHPFSQDERKHSDFSILFWQHIGDNFWQHCDNRSEWKKHTELDKPVHPSDLEAWAGQSSATGRRCPIPGCWVSSQQHESIHPHRPFSIHVHHPTSPSSCFSPWKYLTDRCEWEGKQWFGHVLWSWRWRLHEWWGYPWKKSQNRWHQ